MNIVGLSCYYHDAAAAVVRGGDILAAAQEERFDRRKGSEGLPSLAVNACLQHAGITLEDVPAVAFYEKPFSKLERVIMGHLRAWPRSYRTFLNTLPPWLEDRLVLPLALKRELAFEGQVHFVPHHLSHAASAFLPSPFDQAAIITADGVGEWHTTTMGVGRGTTIELQRELRYPDSLGLLYTAITTWLGFQALRGEGKVMALAELGEPAHLEDLERLIQLRPDGSFRLDREAFGIVEGDRMYGQPFVERFGPARQPGTPLEQTHRDMACSLQRLLEKALLAMARHQHERTGLTKLCVAGGVGLNITATSRILEETPFEEIFIQPAAGDAGGALGAALWLAAATGAERGAPMHSAALGPSYPSSHALRALRSHGLAHEQLEENELCRRTARLIADDRIVGWFQGRLEFGPRALGQRSILANPCNPDMKDILNDRIKHREPFRPYGVSVLHDSMDQFFEPARTSPFMLQVSQVRDDKREVIPAAMHVNGSSRLQTVTAEHNGIYHRLISAFRDITGVPMVINTSFNDSGEPIVCTPEDAVRCFLATELDALVIGNLLVTEKPEPRA